MESKIERLAKYLNDNFENLEQDGASGTSDLNFPHFDLTPHDYLYFAGKDISHSSHASRINTVSNLKRALECELDILLHVLGLNDKKKYSSNVPKKLDFMDKLGLISPRSFKKLNTIRNKIEHEYYVPDENEIDTFYDLIFMLISSIESFYLNFSTYQSMDFSSSEDAFLINDYKFYFTVAYNYELPSIQFELYTEGQKEILIFNSDNYEEFIFAFSTYILLMKSVLIFNKVNFQREFNKFLKNFQ